ncbi:MAG: hypothetical protein IT486_08615 [Gammaproteobacteria bacterium]|nr:hypothetical protein [Gammaproteobacteria bacterium]
MARTAAPRLYPGACHCGALEFTFETALSPQRWPVLACQCGFCRSHGAATTADPRGEVRFTYAYPDRLRRYRFALRSTDYFVCRECGCYLGAVMMTGVGAVAAINVNVLRERPRGLAAAKTANGYRSESLEERRAHRRAQWTPVFGPV